MGTDHTNNYILEICLNVLYKEADTDDILEFLKLLEEINIAELDEFTMLWCLNALNFLSFNNTPNKSLFVKIELVKLKFLSKFLDEYSYLKNAILEESEEVQEVLEKNEIGTIYKRYLPTKYVKFPLPDKGQTHELQIRDTNEKGEAFKATVLIDSKGYVQEIVKPLKLVNDLSTDIDYSDLYTDMLSDILRYDEE